jgi:hypothetical protein
MHRRIFGRTAALVVGGLLVIVVSAFDGGRGRAVAQSPPPANDGDYFRAYAETLEEARQACTQNGIRMRLNVLEEQKKLTAAQQRIADLEAQLKVAAPPLPTAPAPAAALEKEMP